MGDRLRKADHLAAADLREYQELRDVHEAQLAVVQRRLAESGIQSTGRTKTHNTLVDKLKRESIRLSQVQDIAGCRVVVDGGRAEQDEVVERVMALYPDAKPVDRRAAPTHGYRAVHVIVEEGRCKVEVQVRTANQDTWAQIVESLADTWGRQLRYGGTPTDPDRTVLRGDEGPVTRHDVWELILEVGDLVDAYESGAPFPHQQTETLLMSFRQLADILTSSEDQG